MGRELWMLLGAGCPAGLRTCTVVPASQEAGVRSSRAPGPALLNVFPREPRSYGQANVPTRGWDRPDHGVTCSGLVPRLRTVSAAPALLVLAKPWMRIRG